MAKGDQSAPIPGLARFIADAKGEVKDLTKQIKELEKGFKKVGKLSGAEAAQLDTLYKRRDALKYQLQNDADLKKASADVKFLRAVAVGGALTRLARDGFSKDAFIQLASDPAFIDSFGRGLQRLGKTRLLAGRGLGNALGTVGGALGTVGLVNMVAQMAYGAITDEMVKQSDEQAQGFEASDKNLATAHQLGIDPKQLNDLRIALEDEAARQTSGEDNKIFGLIPVGPSGAAVKKTREKMIADRLRKIAAISKAAQGMTDHELNDLVSGTDLAFKEFLGGDESEVGRQAIVARLAMTKEFAAAIDAVIADQTAEAKRREEHRRTASPSVLYKETMQEQLEHAHFAARRTVINQPSWLPEVNYD